MLASMLFRDSSLGAFYKAPVRKVRTDLHRPHLRVIGGPGGVKGSGSRVYPKTRNPKLQRKTVTVRRVPAEVYMSSVSHQLIGSGMTGLSVVRTSYIRGSADILGYCKRKRKVCTIYGSGFRVQGFQKVWAPCVECL